MQQFSLKGRQTSFESIPTQTATFTEHTLCPYLVPPVENEPQLWAQTRMQLSGKISTISRVSLLHLNCLWNNWNNRSCFFLHLVLRWSTIPSGLQLSWRSTLQVVRKRRQSQLPSRRPATLCLQLVSADLPRLQPLQLWPSNLWPEWQSL